jgi:hypothetical protein
LRTPRRRRVPRPILCLFLLILCKQGNRGEQKYKYRGCRLISEGPGSVGRHGAESSVFVLRAFRTREQWAQRLHYTPKSKGHLDPGRDRERRAALRLETTWQRIFPQVLAEIDRI